MVTKQWDIEYVDGCGYKHSNLYNIFWNLLLVVNKIRPSFMIQPIDYDKDVRTLIVNLILSDVLSYKHENKHVFEVTNINQGILVYLSEHVSDEETYNFVQENIIKYKRDNDNISIGDLLGYPCSGDMDIPMLDEHRGDIALYVGDVGIMSNICSSCNKQTFFEKVNKFNKIKNALNNIKNSYPELEHLHHVFKVTYRLTI